jgi:hypothetical protein
MARRGKYNNVKTQIDGITFDSKKEAARYSELRLLEISNHISDLECQPKIPLMVNGEQLGHYIGDFRYCEAGEVIIEDVKSKATITPVYRLKKKILSTYDPPINIREYFG